MPETANVSVSLTVDNQTFTQAGVNTGPTIKRATPSVPAAKTGQLTTRTNNTDGTLTMDPGHGFATADKIDLFWAGGQRRNVTVGTVATNSVPISGGTGDNLPNLVSGSFPITAMKPTQTSLPATGDNVDALAVAAEVPAFVVFRSASNTVLAAYSLVSGALAQVWAASTGATNPLAGGAVDHVLMSHGDSTQARTVTGVLVE
jgi:hypothetical protein